MAWNQGKPAASTYLVSADLRSNWAAIADQALGRNLLGDPDFLIWAAGTTGSAPTWWNLVGQTSAGNINRFVSTTAIVVPGVNSAVKLTYAAALTLHQNAISTGDMTTSIKAAFDGQSISAGVWVYTDSADCKLVMQGPSSNVLSTAITTGSWQWVTKTLTLVSSTMSRVGMGVKLNASGLCYVACPTLVLGPIPPDYYVPGESRQRELILTIPEDPPTAGTALNWRPAAPCKINLVSLSAADVASCSVNISCNHYNGTSFLPLLTTGNRLTMAAGGGRSEVTPDGTIKARSFTRPSSGDDITNCIMDVVVEKASASGGKFPVLNFSYITYDPPLQVFRASPKVFK